MRRAVKIEGKWEKNGRKERNKNKRGRSNRFCPAIKSFKDYAGKNCDDSTWRKRAISRLQKERERERRRDRTVFYGSFASIIVRLIHTLSKAIIQMITECRSVWYDLTWFLVGTNVTSRSACVPSTPTLRVSLSLFLCVHMCVRACVCV